MVGKYWLNVTKVIEPNMAKPCSKLMYCPYGGLVEEYPLREPKTSELSCPIFGHDCPVHYQAEFFSNVILERG